MFQNETNGKENFNMLQLYRARKLRERRYRASDSFRNHVSDATDFGANAIKLNDENTKNFIRLPSE